MAGSLSGGGGSLTIANNHFFASTGARDTFFAANPGQRKSGVFISVGSGYQEWNGSAWLDKTAVVRGPAGPSGASASAFSALSDKDTADLPSINLPTATAIAGAKARANHTGSQSADTITDGSTNKAYSAGEKTKLAGVAAGATANSSDAVLVARASHTGSQSADTITDGSTNKAYSAAEKSKLAGVASAAVARNYLGPAADQAAMLALSAAVRGDWVKRTDLGGQVFELTTAGPSTLGNWTAQPTGSGASAFSTLSDKDTADLPSINLPTATAIAGAKARANHTGSQSADTITDGSTNKAYSGAEKTKLAGVAAGATANSSDAVLVARASHTGTQSADTITDGATNKAYSAAEKSKLAGVAASAVARNYLGPAADQSAMLALSAAVRGDWVKRTDLGGQVFELTTAGPGTLANWTAQPTGSGGAITFSALSDAPTVDIPATNAPTAAAIAAKVANDLTASTTVAPSKTAVNNALVAKADLFAAAVVIASGTLTQAAHFNRHVSARAAGAITLAVSATATEGALLEVSNDGTAAAVTFTGVSAPTGYRLDAQTGETFQAVFTNGAWKSLSPVAKADLLAAVDITGVATLTQAAHFNRHLSWRGTVAATRAVDAIATEGDLLELSNDGSAALYITGVTAATGYRLDVQPGEPFGAVFTNGAWKSTTAAVLASLGWTELWPGAAGAAPPARWITVAGTPQQDGNGNLYFS